MMMFLDILTAILRAIRVTYENDRTAFAVGCGMIGILILVPSAGTVTFWAKLDVAAYFLVLYLAAKKGEKIEIEQSFRRAVERQSAAGPPIAAEVSASSTAPQAEPQRPAEPGHPSETGPAKNQPSESTPELPKPIKRGVQFVGDFLSDSQKTEASAINIQAVEQHLRSKIRGQDHAIDAVTGTLKRAAAGIRTKSESPLCVFLFLGATGTGKTEIVKQISEATRRPLVRFDMPNYSTEAGIWELIGSPPGYVGSDKPGRLTGEIRNNPDAVLLLDEIEKAHPRMWDPFLRVLDEGKLKDQAQGFTADFRKILIFLTSNLLQHEDHIDDEKALRNKVLNEGYFRPELLNRIDRFVMFKPFGPQTLREIIAGTLQRFAETFRSTNKLDAEVRIDRRVIEQVLGAVDPKFGARDIQRYIEKYLGDALAEAWIEARGRRVSLIEINGIEEVKLS